MPVLILLLFYIHDLVKIKRYYSQTEFVAQQFANIIQNISQKRTDRRIYYSDLRYAFVLACHSLYPANTLFAQGGRFAFGHFPIIVLHYVKGTGNGQASHHWKDFLTSYIFSDAPQHILRLSNDTGDRFSYSLIKELQDAPPTSIYKTLKISGTEEKIIVECVICNDEIYKNLEGKYLPPREAFGLKLVSPKGLRGKAYFHSVVIFTPKPGLFSTDPPTEN